MEQRELKNTIDFIIIGGQKCASTYIQGVVDEHPDVYLHPGEVTYFQDPDYLDTPFTNFMSRFERVPVNKKIGIKRPDYLAKRECAARIKEHFPNVKLIVTLRNPVERAIAAYYHYINDGFIPPLKAEEGFKKIFAGELNEFPRANEIIEYGFYHKHLSNYFKFFDRDQFFILQTEDLKSAYKAAMMLYSFLGIDSNFSPAKAFNKRPQKVVYSYKLLNIIVLKNKINYKYNAERTRLYPNYKSSIGKLRFRAINWIVKQAAHSSLNQKKPIVAGWVREELHRIYHEDIKNLESLLAKDLSHWDHY